MFFDSVIEFWRSLSYNKDSAGLKPAAEFLSRTGAILEERRKIDMYCTNCGKELPDGASVCDECGTPTGSQDARQENTARGHRPYMDYQPFSGGETTYGQQDSRQENSYGQQDPYGQQNAYDYDQQNPYRNSQYGGRRDPEGHTGLAIAGFVLGIIGICSCCIPILSIPIGVLGLIFSIIGLKSSYRGLAIAGVVLNVIAIVLGILMILVVLVSDDHYIHYYWNLYDY